MAGTITVVFHAAVILYLIWKVIYTPIPPFPIEPEPPEVTYEITDFGTNVEGTGSVENNNKGDNESKDNSAVAASNNSSSESSSANNENVITNEGEQSVHIEKSISKTPKTPEVKVEQPVEQKASDELQKALQAIRDAKNRKAGNPGGDGQSGVDGNKGTPNGDPNADGIDPYGEKYGVRLKGRKIVKPPDIADNSQEEGTVIVAIVVDVNGKVISAEPGQRNSTTTSSMLWTIARQAALSTKFNPSPEGVAEQRTTMTFKFVLN